MGFIFGFGFDNIEDIKNDFTQKLKEQRIKLGTYDEPRTRTKS